MDRSPLALYLLALFREAWPTRGPWRARDDAEDLMRVILACPTGEVAIRVVQKRGGVLVTVKPCFTEADERRWEEEIWRAAQSALGGCWSVGDHQRLWMWKRSSAITPEPAEDREG